MECLLMIILLIIFYIFLNKNLRRKKVEGFENSDIKKPDKKEKKEEVESIDKNRMGCFKRKTPVIYTKDKRFTTSSFSLNNSKSGVLPTKGEVIKGKMCNEKWGEPTCVNQPPSETIQKILESSKINPFRGYRQNADLYYLDYIHYLNDQPLPISTSFFS